SASDMSWSMLAWPRSMMPFNCVSASDIKRCPSPSDRVRAASCWLFRTIERILSCAPVYCCHAEAKAASFCLMPGLESVELRLLAHQILAALQYVGVVAFDLILGCRQNEIFLSALDPQQVRAQLFRQHRALHRAFDQPVGHRFDRSEATDPDRRGCRGKNNNRPEGETQFQLDRKTHCLAPY